MTDSLLRPSSLCDTVPARPRDSPPVSVRILHISDLHRAGSQETLKAIWVGPQNALRRLPEPEQRFDLIIVSGDLAGAARQVEYDELLEFSHHNLLPLLRDPGDRARVVFVPGNHDVDWAADLGRPLPIAEMLERPGGSDQLARLLKNYRDDPARSGVRQVVSRYGHLEWLLLDPERQMARFAGVQRFLDTFYKDDALAEPGRRFDLLAPAEGLDWSAHLFPEDRVAVYGFNSCFLNDRYWTGAAISRESIARAAEHAAVHADGFLRIAVWHHGIAPDGVRPDYLNQADLGALIVAGFQVGFHGHLHKAGAQQLGWLTDRFVLVGTGSLGANQNQRPDAVGKQFSTVSILPHQLHVHVFERTGDMPVYTRRPPRSFPLGLREHAVAEHDHELIAGEHARHAHVDRHGISTVSVRITDLRAAHPVAIAEVVPPVCAARADPLQSARGFTVHQKTGQDGTIRFTLFPPDPRPTDLVWRYQASNVVPLTRAEVPRYTLQSRGHDDPDDTVLRGHTVRFPSRRLTLTYSFDDPVVDLDSVELRVDRCAPHDGDLLWERVPEEERRCEIIKKSPLELALAVDAPIVGCRYGLAYRPSVRGDRLNFKAVRIAAKLLDGCTADREFGPVLAFQLAESISAAVSAVFDASIAAISWMGLLWDDAQGRLLPAFGNFPSREWSASYPHGTGVAGHAFRFNRPAAWCRTTQHSKDALIYQRHPPHQHWKSEQDWIVCVPLVGDGAKNPLGVVQFEGGGKRQGLGGRLYEFANAALANAASKGSSWEVFQQTLSSTVNTGFWQACALAECLGDYREDIRELISTLRLGGPPDESLTDGSRIQP